MAKYIVESYAFWFIVDANTKRQAYSEGVKEFGRGGVKSVLIATEADIQYFKSVKGDDAIMKAEAKQ